VLKLLGDGAMLHLPDASRGVEAALELVRALSVRGGISAHASVHAGPVIERDRDLFGRTVNLASRIAEVPRPGEVLTTQAVVDSVHDSALHFEAADGARLKGIPELVPLFRASTNGDAL
jgi:adenylate cyclase